MTLTYKRRAGPNKERYVSAYAGIPRQDVIHPDSTIRNRSHIFAGFVTEFDCGCVVKEWSSGIATRAGCSVHGDALRLKCPVVNCGKTFKTKVDFKAHREEHRY
jgi:hypothetical protein